MSFPRYPIYKDSGVETVTGIPQAWTPTRLRFLLRDGYNGLKIGPFGSQLTSEMLADDGSYKVYGQENVIANDFARGSRYINEDKFHELSVYEVTPGDLLITMMGTSGRCDVAPSNLEKGIMDSHLLRMRVLPSVSAEFVRLLIDEAAYVGTQIELAGKGSIMHGLNSTIVKNLLLFIPSTDEQTQILTFLDRETAKIDALVAEQRRLMELLKEKRQAVISHAVSRGLNPDAPMKPSGIEWLGDVPAHWATPAMYMRYSSELGKMLDSSKITGNHLVPYMRNVDVQWGLINFDDLPYMDIHEEEYERYTVETGDLLVCEGGEVGRAAIVPTVSGFFGYQKALHRLRPLDASEDSRFMYFTLLWAANTGIFDQSGSSTIAHLTGEQLRKYRFPKPPIAEQRKIAVHLESESSKFDTLTAEAQRAIDLLQERRTALISAVVTGQIDVRHMTQSL